MEDEEPEENKVVMASKNTAEPDGEIVESDTDKSPKKGCNDEKEDSDGEKESEDTEILEEDFLMKAISGTFQGNNIDSKCGLCHVTASSVR